MKQILSILCAFVYTAVAIYLMIKVGPASELNFVILVVYGVATVSSLYLIDRFVKARQ